MRPVPPELDRFLAPYPRVVRDVAISLRSRVLSVVPKAHETVWDATNAVSLAYSAEGRHGTDLWHLASFSKHVNLGFSDGASLIDPLDVLRGTGVRIRHATFREVEDTQAGWIDEYLMSALKFAGLTESMGDGGTTIKVMNGPKRRPNPAPAT